LPPQRRISDEHTIPARPERGGTYTTHGALPMRHLLRRFQTPRGDGALIENAGRQEALCSAQADSGMGVRHPQIAHGLPPIYSAWDRPGARRMEPCDQGLEHEADVHPSARRVRRAEHSLHVQLRQKTFDRRSPDAKRIRHGCRLVAPRREKLPPKIGRKPGPDRLPGKNERSRRAEVFPDRYWAHSGTTRREQIFLDFG
jgi:hypothetical protein